MEKAGFIERLGRENVCPHIDAALARAREILGLPAVQAADPNFEDKPKLEVVRLEFTNALDRANPSLDTMPPLPPPSAPAPASPEPTR